MHFIARFIEYPTTPTLLVVGNLNEDFIQAQIGQKIYPYAYEVKSNPGKAHFLASSEKEASELVLKLNAVSKEHIDFRGKSALLKELVANPSKIKYLSQAISDTMIKEYLGEVKPEDLEEIDYWSFGMV